MPISREKIRQFDRKATVKALVADCWGVLDCGKAHPLLAGFKPAERGRILREAEALIWPKETN